MSTIDSLKEFHGTFGNDFRREKLTHLSADGEAPKEDELAALEFTLQKLTELKEELKVFCKKEQSVLLLRLRLFVEETAELTQGLINGDDVEVLDALSDIQYILDGTYYNFGMADVKLAAFDEVHRSNMSKVGADGKPIINKGGKVQKGPNYFPPNLAKILENRSD